jgi:histidinol-phosphate aminotransferase
LPNPNNPTGTAFTDQDFQAFHKQVPRTSAILLDQAYYEYAIEDPAYGRLPYLEYENLIVLRTVSKAYGLAGLRLGYSLASQQITDQLLKTQLAFETNCVAEVAAIAALDDQDFIGASVNMNRRTRAESFTTLCDLGTPSCHPGPTS